MRSIWNGAISFGLVSIPIKLVNATESHSISFRQIHVEDGGRIRYRKVCEMEDREVRGDEIGKAYESADGAMIPITDDDLASLPLPTAKAIEIVAFVPSDRIDPLQMDAAYYLSANGIPAAKPYTLLREVLKRSQKVAIAKFAFRGRERLGMLRVVDDVIAMHGLLWPDEIRATEGVAPGANVTVRDQELDLADTLMATFGEVDLADLHDGYREAVEELIAAKASGEEAPHAPEPSGGGKALDLMAALEKSVRKAKESRGEEVERAEEAAEAAQEGEVKPLHGRRKAAASVSASKAAPRKAAKATPKAEAGKKSTSTAKKATAKKTATTKKSTGGAKKSTSTARKATAKSAAAKKTLARKRSA